MFFVTALLDLREKVQKIKEDAEVQGKLTLSQFSSLTNAITSISEAMAYVEVGSDMERVLERLKEEAQDMLERALADPPSEPEFPPPPGTPSPPTSTPSGLTDPTDPLGGFR